MDARIVEDFSNLPKGVEKATFSKRRNAIGAGMRHARYEL
jgi:hypothetical protein